MRRLLPLLALAALLLAATARAHEVRPGFLQLSEEGAGQYQVTWKVPMRGGMELRLAPRFPSGCAAAENVLAYRSGGAVVRRWTQSCADGLVGRTLGIDGLQTTLTDVLVRIDHADGRSQTMRLTPSAPAGLVAVAPGWRQVAVSYLGLGIEHILLGIDHLLFVFALLLLVRGVRRLIATITAFTVAHSITLALATLGILQVPGPPVEAVIALSIVFVAAELAHRVRGASGLTERAPWLVAFAFGLLHGLGFAGALSEVGLPEGAIPLALLFFNLGVEAGQLLFVAAVLTLGWLLRRVGRPLPQAAHLTAAYAIGGIAAYWMFDRIAGFWT